MDIDNPINFVEVELIWDGGDGFYYLYTLPIYMVHEFEEYSEEFGEEMTREKYSDYLVFNINDWIYNESTITRKIYIKE